MANKTIAELKALMQANANKTTKGSIGPADVFKTMEYLLDTLNELGVTKVDQALRDLGQYSNANKVTLSVGVSGKYINTKGVQTSNGSYAMSNRIDLKKGYLYLVKATGNIGGDVSLFSKYETNIETLPIEYSYTYDSKGRIATATADYDHTMVYTYTYTEDANGGEHLQITDKNGVEVHYLPHVRKSTVGSYVPLFTQGNLGVPSQGYFVFLCTEDMSAVISALTGTISNGEMISVEYGAFFSIVDEFATKREMNKKIGLLADSLDELDEKVSDLSLGSQTYCVAEYDPASMSPDAYKVHGSRAFANNWHFYLIDVTVPAVDGKIPPVGELMPNNLFRFTNGKFAPAVCIPASEYDECNVALYLKNDGTNLYCEASAFDAEAFYNEYGEDTPLYTASGTKVRVRKPWETKDVKYSIGVSRDSDIYVLDGQVGDSGKTWKGIFGQPMTWDGIDVTPFKLEPTLMPLNAITNVGNKPYGFYFSYSTNQNNCKGSKGVDNLIDWWDGATVNRTYPLVNTGETAQASQCRSHNEDTSKPYPFAEGGFLTLNAYIISQEVLYGTNDLHQNTRFGSGISSNDSCVDEASYFLNGGVRYRVVGGSSWSYATIGSSINIWNASRKKYGAYELLNNWYPKEECYESQVVASYIKEKNISALDKANNATGARFTWNGGTYFYNNVDTINEVTPETILGGRMNARIYRLMPKKTISAYDAEGNSVSYEIEFCQRMSLYGGVKLAGDIFIAWPGGLEIIGTCTNATQGSTGNVSDVYIQPDQKKWHTDGTVSKDNLGRWSFEDTYIPVGKFTGGEGYILSRIQMSPTPSEFGGNLHTKVAGYCWGRNYWSSTLNQRVRQMKRFGGDADLSLCAPRFLNCDRSVANTTLNLGCSAQCLLQVDAVPQRSK